jgi:hypothetical protein
LILLELLGHARDDWLSDCLIGFVQAERDRVVERRRTPYSIFARRLDD